MRILYIEDDSCISNLAKMVFMRTTHDLVMCPSPMLAKRVLDLEKIDLIILDMVFPEGSGMDVVDHIRDNRMSVPVFVYSGYIEKFERSMQHYLGIGVIRKIYRKPDCTFPEIIADINKLLA